MLVCFGLTQWDAHFSSPDSRMLLHLYLEGNALLHWRSLIQKVISGRDIYHLELTVALGWKAARFKLRFAVSSVMTSTEFLTVLPLPFPSLASWRLSCSLSPEAKGILSYFQLLNCPELEHGLEPGSGVVSLSSQSVFLRGGNKVTEKTRIPVLEPQNPVSILFHRVPNTYDKHGVAPVGVEPHTSSSHCSPIPSPTIHWEYSWETLSLAT